jgi:hypothetical protein
MSRHRVPWEGADPKVGDYLAGRAKCDAWLIAAVSPIRRHDATGARLTLDMRRVTIADVPRGATLHPRTRIAAVDPLGPAVVRIHASHGETAVMKTQWRDPDDMRPNAAHRPREITGYRTFCPLRRMARLSGSQITEAHIAAADALRLAVDIATIGLTGEQSGVHGVYGPTFGPSINAVLQAQAGTEATQVIWRLAPSQHRMTEAIVLRNRSLQAWCTERAAETRRTVSPEVEMGRLLALLDVLADHYGLQDMPEPREVVG